MITIKVRAGVVPRARRDRDVARLVRVLAAHGFGATPGQARWMWILHSSDLARAAWSLMPESDALLFAAVRPYFVPGEGAGDLDIVAGGPRA